MQDRRFEPLQDQTFGVDLVVDEDFRLAAQGRSHQEQSRPCGVDQVLGRAGRPPIADRVRPARELIEVVRQDPPPDPASRDEKPVAVLPVGQVVPRPDDRILPRLTGD